jgi:histidine triad (HIT) family protein
MATIFTKIINKEIPSHKIAENDKFYAFLDINPLAKGHTLVIPKKEINYIFDVEDDLLSEMIVFSKKVAKAIEKYIPCKRIGVTVIGLEVPHAHIHLIPINCINDMEFSKKKIAISNDELKQIAKNISSFLE